MNIALAIYRALKKTVNNARMMNAGFRRPATAVKISSLLQNPDSMGIPPRDSAPTEKRKAVRGMARRNPPIIRISCCSVLCNTLPAPRKSRALANPWTSRWKIAAV